MEKLDILVIHMQIVTDYLIDYLIVIDRYRYLQNNVPAFT